MGIGQAHTITLELNTKIEIAKDCWDSVFRETLDEATDVARAAEVLAYSRI